MFICMMMRGPTASTKYCSDFVQMYLLTVFTKSYLKNGLKVNSYFAKTLIYTKRLMSFSVEESFYRVNDQFEVEGKTAPIVIRPLNSQ